MPNGYFKWRPRQHDWRHYNNNGMPFIDRFLRYTQQHIHLHLLLVLMWGNCNLLSQWRKYAAWWGWYYLHQLNRYNSFRWQWFILFSRHRCLSNRRRRICIGNHIMYLFRGCHPCNCCCTRSGMYKLVLPLLFKISATNNPTSWAFDSPYNEYTISGNLEGGTFTYVDINGLQ